MVIIIIIIAIIIIINSNQPQGDCAFFQPKRDTMFFTSIYKII